jgi:hypothetical protein
MNKSTLIFLICLLTISITCKKLKQPSTKVSWLCSPLTLYYQEVSAQCENSNGDWVDVTKDLNECIGLQNGHLVKMAGGDFSTCEGCTISEELWCNCYDDEYNPVESHLIMDDIIEFKEDALHCR